MSGLCAYSNVFGEPGEGAHAFRLGGLAAVDLLATAALAYIGARYGIGRVNAVTFVFAFLVLILTAVLVHEAFCVNTRLDAAIFGRDWPAKNSPLLVAG